MPSAIVTVRELKNKDVGIDITIPVHKEIKGLLNSTWEYYVVVVSNLPYFKSPKHKDSDVVQFMVQKKFSDFETLHSRLTEKYPATILPNLPRKQLITTENVVKERKQSLEKFLQFVASINKLANSFVFLEFLGVNSMKAGKFRKDQEETDDSTEKETSATPEQEVEEETETQRNLFDDVDTQADEDADLFADDVTGFTETNDDILNLSLATTRDEDDTKLFESPDLRGGIDEGEEDTLFVPGSNIPAIIKTKTVQVMEDENSDLFNIEDDLERFELRTEDLKRNEATGADKEEEKEAKPKVPEKPTVHQKPKLTPKPQSLNTSKPLVKPKPTPRPKPPVAKKPSSSDQSVTITKDDTSQSKDVTSLETNDILSYIQTNVNNDDDVDLFS